MDTRSLLLLRMEVVNSITFCLKMSFMFKIGDFKMCANRLQPKKMVIDTMIF